jgi:hypothetical protein
MAINLSAQTFSIAKFSIGETRIKLDQNDFEIKHNSSKVQVQFVSESVQWIRNESNLLIPRSLMAVGVQNDAPNIYLTYFGKKIIPVRRSNYFYTELYVDLFNPGEVKVFQGSKLLDSIFVESISTNNAKSKQLIDYSCAPYQLKIEGIDSEYLSIGCKMGRVGNLFNEYPRLEVTFSSTNLKTLANDRPPLTFYLKDNTPIEFQVLDSKNKIQTIKISATLPKKLTRLKTALGFGPYIYESRDTNALAKNEFAPSVMIYGKLELTETSSLKAFDALLYSKSLFNNSGMYFSYDLAELFDGRILIDTLLGFQGLNYRYKKGSPTEFRLIYPQGFEVVYKHAFGIQNKHLTYGMFLSTNTSEPYTNSWIRWGGKLFFEINYINWEHLDKKITMSGLSIGFPFLEAF